MVALRWSLMELSIGLNSPEKKKGINAWYEQAIYRGYIHSNDSQEWDTETQQKSKKSHVKGLHTTKRYESNGGTGPWQYHKFTKKGSTASNKPDKGKKGVEK